MPSQRHTIYVRSRPAELWAALTEGETSAKYYFDSAVESSFEVGAPLRYLVMPDDDEPNAEPTVAVEGEVVEVQREALLVHTFRFCDLGDDATTVRWQLSTGVGPEVIRVDVIHEGFASENASWERINHGWPVILSGLKTWLETGEALGVITGPPPGEDGA